ncbi:PIN domain-containing protein [Psychrobacter sp. Ps2]|uniref:type II toxin-antitoxin system VapC family toxin n=1 Tax=unclassified Psychrobacter TaxID=196806 RepID=UPI001EE0AF44|nr:PIN domain-containing protein [Psychrobacter sp. Ps2]MCG3857459.1 PIN domain-containing protein [Psychrobacter sp. Ps2]
MKEKEKLLDTNYLIGLLEGKSDGDDTELLQNLKDLRNEIKSENVEVVITPLIRYEFLRYFLWKTQESDIKKYIDVMNGLTTLDISQDVADLAADLYRLDKFEASKKNINKNIDKRQFDIFHFATAKINGIELLSNDKHLPQLEDLYKLYELDKIL